MKKMLVTLLLTLVSTSALADWEKVNEDDSTTTYIDSASIKKTNSNVAVWILQDFKVAKTRLTRGLDVKNYLSSTSLVEFDCRGGFSIFHFTALYVQSMAKGGIIESDNGSYKVPVAPNSISERILKVACGVIQPRSSKK